MVLHVFSITRPFIYFIWKSVQMFCPLSISHFLLLYYRNFSYILDTSPVSDTVCTISLPFDGFFVSFLALLGLRLDPGSCTWYRSALHTEFQPPHTLLKFYFEAYLANLPHRPQISDPSDLPSRMNVIIALRHQNLLGLLLEKEPRLALNSWLSSSLMLRLLVCAAIPSIYYRFWGVFVVVVF